MVKQLTVIKRSRGQNIDERALAKVWISFNGIGEISITRSFNVESIADIGPGIFEINFMVPFVNPDYCFAGSAGSDVSTTGTGRIVGPDAAREVDKLRIRVTYDGNVVSDQPYIGLMIFGE